MINVRVTQFETRAFEAEAKARLDHERRAARALRRTARRRRRLVPSLPALRPVPPAPGDCEA